MTESDYQHFLGKVRDAKNGGHGAWTVMSTGEKTAVAIALNRADWIAQMNYTLAEAIERTGAQWISLLPKVVRAIADQD